MRFNSAFLTLCLAAGTLASTIEKGIATRWYPTGQPQGLCGPEPSYTVAISEVFNITTLCGTWVVINSTDNPEIEPLRASITTPCTTCAEGDLALGSNWYFYLTNTTDANLVAGTEPASVNIEWYFCNVDGGEC